MTAPPRRYTAKEVCDRFRVSRKTLDRWTRERILTKVSDGYRNLYDADQVDKLIREGTSERVS